MYFSPTKLRRLYHWLREKIKCLFKEAKRINIIFLIGLTMFVTVLLTFFCIYIFLFFFIFYFFIFWWYFSSWLLLCHFHLLVSFLLWGLFYSYGLLILDIPLWLGFWFLLMATPWSMSLRRCEWLLWMAFVNEGCVVVGKPHPRHPFTKPHPIVYEIAEPETRNPKKNLWRMQFPRVKNQCLQDEGVDCSFHRTRAFVWDFEVPKGSLSSQWNPLEEIRV
jgi:hypothetical protein